MLKPYSSIKKYSNICKSIVYRIKFPTDRGKGKITSLNRNNSIKLIGSKL